MIILAVLVLSSCFGFLGSLLGIGGGTFLIPALVVGLGMDPLHAMPISLLCALATGISGTLFHQMDFGLAKRALIFEPAAILGALVFTPLAYLMATKSLMLLFAAFILLSAIVSMKSPQLLTEAKAGGSATINNARGIFASTITGASAGIFGVGGGIVLVPLLKGIANISLRDAMQISLFIMISTSVVALIMHATLGEIPWVLGLAGVAGATPAAFLGAKYRKKIDDRLLAKVFLLFAAIISFAMIFKAFKVD